ncbi:MAG: hypothetical protein MZV70_67695 [Desulfobacterales bacterium]|nr:hypothetical protein [Desulfobacterales bacterium]
MIRAGPLVTFHPLQPFSANYFTGGSALFSYSAEDLAGVRPRAAAPSSARPVHAGADAADGRGSGCLQPAGYRPGWRSFRQPGQIPGQKPPGDAPRAAGGGGFDCEPFSLAGLERFTVGSQAARAASERLSTPGRCLRRCAPTAGCRTARVGEVEFRELWTEVDRFARRLDALRPAAAPAALDARWEIAGFDAGGAHHRALRQRLPALSFRQAARQGPARRSGSQHLALCLAAPADGELESVFVGTDRTLRLKRVSGQLGRHRGVAGHLPTGPRAAAVLFPECRAGVCQRAARILLRDGRALGSARSIWDGSDCIPERSADPYYRRCFETIDPLGVEFRNVEPPGLRSALGPRQQRETGVMEIGSIIDLRPEPSGKRHAQARRPAERESPGGLRKPARAGGSGPLPGAGRHQLPGGGRR